MTSISDTAVQKLSEKAYRDAFVEAHLKIGIPYQIKALREQKGRKWSQAELGRRCKKPANVISRLEDPEYGRHTLGTLLELASAFDVALLVKFVSYSRFLNEFENVSPQALEVPSFTSDERLLAVTQVQEQQITSNVVNVSVDMSEVTYTLVQTGELYGINSFVQMGCIGGTNISGATIYGSISQPAGPTLEGGERHAES